MAISYIELYQYIIDVHMESPPRHKATARPPSPVFDLAGASRITGGIIRGRAQGNVFNHADAHEITQSLLGPRVGQVQIFTSHADPAITKPHMVLKHEVTLKLAPVLKALARKYSPVCSKHFLLFVNLVTCYLFIYFR